MVLRMILILYFGSYSSFVEASIPKTSLETTQSIRIRLVQSPDAVEIRGFDLKFFDQHRPQFYASRLSSWRFHCSNQSGNLTVKAYPRDTHKLSDVQTYDGAVMVTTPAGFLTFQGRPYREKIWIHAVKQGDQVVCEAVNHVDVEKYLDGLVNAEFSAKWNEEAIAAQVIAARTYAFYQMNRARERPKSRFDVDATTKDQVYDGTMKEDYRSSRSVNRTRGIVLKPTLSASEPIKAFYHSTCGGLTELPSRVWGPGKYPGFKRIVTCSYCSASPRFQWNIDLQTADIKEFILRSARDADFSKQWPHNWEQLIRNGELANLRVQNDQESGRVKKVVSIWKTPDFKYQELIIPAVKFRNWMGAAKMRSTAFQISRNASGDWEFRGRGNGHGVGMCQWGAKVMGEKGFKMEAILKHYYPDAVLARAW